MSGPGRRERFYGWLSGRALVRVNRLALKRGDAHESRHVMAAVVAGNSTHDTGAPCFLMMQGAEESLATVANGWLSARRSRS